MKKTFFLKLNAFKPFTMETISEEEKLIMQAHQQYLFPYMNDGTIIVMGPVFDPKGIFGIAIIEIESEEKLNAIIEKDPVLKIGNYEVLPMMAAHK